MNFFGYLDPTTQTNQFAREFDIVGGTSYCVVAATSLISTSVIAAQIYSSTNVDPRARRRYMYIVEITTQSSALYTLSTISAAVTGLINNADFNAHGSSFFNAESYTNAIACFTTVCSSTTTFTYFSNQSASFCRHLRPL